MAIQQRTRFFAECDLESERNINWGAQTVIHTLEQGTPAFVDGHWWKIVNGAYVETPPFGLVLNGKIFVQTANKTVANTTTETSLIGTGVGSATFPAFVFVVGNQIRINIRGFFSKQSGNATLKVKLGSTIIGTTGTVLPGSASNDAFELDFLFSIRTVGVSGTVIGQGNFFNWNTGNNQQLVSLTTTTIDTTISQTLDVTYQWGTANAGNTITSTNSVLII